MPQHAPNFITDTFSTHAGEIMCDAAHCGFSAGVNHQPESGSKPRRSQCSQAIFMQAVISATDGAQDASGKIRTSTNMINDFAGLGIFKESVDSEIATRRIFTIIAESHRVGAPTIHIHAVSAECCNLD
jgi:hypothetical protein